MILLKSVIHEFWGIEEVWRWNCHVRSQEERIKWKEVEIEVNSARESEDVMYEKIELKNDYMSDLIVATKKQKNPVISRNFD